MGGRKGIRLVENYHKWWGAGVVICLKRGADLHMAQLIPLPLTITCSIAPGKPDWFWFISTVPAHPASTGQNPESRHGFSLFKSMLPSVLWRCWLGGRKGIQHVNKKPS